MFQWKWKPEHKPHFHKSLFELQSDVSNRRDESYYNGQVGTIYNEPYNESSFQTLQAKSFFHALSNGAASRTIAKHTRE